MTHRTASRPAPPARAARAARAAACAVALVAALPEPAAAQQPRLLPVPRVDPVRYAGTWYEVARLPNRFQAQCAGDVVAAYAPRPDGMIDVTNRCRTESGALDEAGALATPQDATNAKLRVSFLPAALRWLPFGRGDYWVLALDADYRWAMVGAPSRDFLWILSRQPTLPEDELDTLLGQAREMGFPADRVVRTPHRAPPR
jgi:apolipoprotein D and lipocalin family protein